MEVIFDCFFEQTLILIDRSGLKTRKKRKDVIDHLNSIITGSSKGTFIYFFSPQKFHIFTPI